MSGKALAAGITASLVDQEPAASAVPLTYFSNDAKRNEANHESESDSGLEFLSGTTPPTAFGQRFCQGDSLQAADIMRAAVLRERCQQGKRDAENDADGTTHQGSG